MPLKEPTPPEKIFTDEFAKSGEVQKVPNDLQADESLSWLGGFTKRFSRIPAKENGLNMTRQTFAGIVQTLSAKILQVEKDLRVRFLKTDRAKIENNDISFLETPKLTTQNLNANKAKIVDFTKELIKPSGKTIITDLTQNAGVISGIDTLTIADKAKSVNIILSPTTSQSVLNNTPPNNASGKELVNAEWVRNNYGTAPSPYIHTFTGNYTTIPYNKIRGLKWVKFKTTYYDFCTDFNVGGGCECGYNATFDLPYKEVDILNSWSLNYNAVYSSFSGECYDIHGLCSCYVGINVNLTYNKKTEKLTSKINYAQTLIFSNKK